MTVQAGTIRGVSLINGDGASGGGRKTYLVSVDFPAYTGSSDSMSIAGVSAAIKDHVKDEHSLALISSCVPVCVGPGLDTASQAVYAGVMTISGDALLGNLTAADGTTELTSATASSGVQLAVTVQQTPVN